MLQNLKMGRAMAATGSFALILALFLLHLLHLAQFGVVLTVLGDVEALKAIKDSVDANSIKAGSCLSSWNAFGECFKTFTRNQYELFAVVPIFAARIPLRSA